MTNKIMFSQHKQDIFCCFLHKLSAFVALCLQAMRLSNDSKRASTQGEVVNLMSVDTQRVQEFLTRAFYGLTTPLQILLALVLIYLQVGVSMFTGFAILVLLIPFNTYMAGMQRKFQEKNLRFKDIRVKLVSEILNGIKVSRA